MRLLGRLCKPRPFQFQYRLFTGVPHLHPYRPPRLTRTPSTTFSAKHLRDKFVPPTLDEQDHLIGQRLQWVLRESAVRVGLPIRPDGFVPVSALCAFSIFRFLPLTLEYLQAMRDADPGSQLELKEETSPDSRTRTWLVRVAGAAKMPGVAHVSRRITYTDLPDIPFTSLLLLVPLSEWPTVRRDGILASKPFLKLETDLPDLYGFNDDEPFVVAVLNVKTCLHLGVTFWLHPDGSVRTMGDSSGYIDPQMFEMAYKVEWDKTTLLSDGNESLAKLKPEGRPSFSDRPRLIPRRVNFQPKTFHRAELDRKTPHLGLGRKMPKTSIDGFPLFVTRTTRAGDEKIEVDIKNTRSENWIIKKKG